MARKRKSSLLLGLLLATSMAAGGCGGASSLLLTPLPVPAWVPDAIAERAQNQNDHRTVVMPPIPPGHTPQCEDPPDKAAILRTMPRVARGVPFIYEEFRDDIETTTEKLVDHMDPPRFYPLIGPAQLHHCHWKCTIYYTESILSSWPLPYRIKRRRVEVVYIDQDHLHMFIVGQEAQREMSRDMMGARQQERQHMRANIPKKSWAIAAVLGLLTGLGLVALLHAQNTANPLQKLFGAPQKKTAPPALPPLREDAYRLAEILIELSWLSDPITFPYYIEAHVVGATVEVRGNVPGKAVREHALKLAGLSSPMTVVDKLKENPRLAFRPVYMTPNQLQKVAASGLRETLPRQAKGLQANCSADGRVAVVGTVDTFEDKLLISQTIRRLHGASMVTNLVRVASDPDGSLAQSLVRSLSGPVTPLAEPRDVAPPSAKPPAGEIALPAVPGNSTVVAGSSPIGKQPGGTDPDPKIAMQPLKKDGPQPNLAHLKKVLEKACPGAKEIKITQIAPGELRIEVYARRVNDNQLADQILGVRELMDNFRPQLSIFYPEK